MFVNLLFPDWGGLDRATGAFAHPTWAAATASLGLLILVLSRFLWGYGWSRNLILPGLLLHGAVLVLAENRLGIALSLCLIGASVLLYASRIWIAVVTAIACTAGLIYIVADSRNDE